jgi:RNA polymerase sigma-70 factor (ECF subfamily)
MTMETAAAPFEQLVAESRSYLLRFARLQLRNDAWAEDCVSETLLAALAKPDAYSQRSQLKTWLVGILKYKILDALRERRHEVVLADDDADGSAEIDALVFQADGHFAAAPADWGGPEQELSSSQFIAVLEACVEKLPVAMGRIFLMREWLELTTADICKEMDISSTNLFVQLHRARLRMRECLELNWFGNAGK